MRYTRFLCFLLLAPLSLISGEVLGDDQELPLLGENARVNLKKEDELGKGLYLKLKEKGYVIENPLLSRYVSDIGETLLSALDVRLRDYKFYLVKDGSVNAFATPGGYIGINVGLIMMASSEDEVASVLAHEIAHVELMHGMQMLEKAQQVNMAGMISILAAILVGSQDSGAASALIYSGVAGGSQAMTNFTRANEYEADRVGIGLLQESDYDPRAMVDFLRLLQSREQTGGLSGIEYIRTHPVNSNRIAEIQSRIQNGEKTALKARRFQQFKDYLLYLYPQGSASTNKTGFSEALNLTRNGQYAAAEKNYLMLIDQDPDSIWYRYALAENMLYQNRLGEAENIYRSLLLVYPHDLAIGTELARACINQGKNLEALKVVNHLLTEHEKEPVNYELLVEIHKQLGDEQSVKLAEADYHWFTGNKKMATALFQTLLKEGRLNAAQETSVKEKLKL